MLIRDPGESASAVRAAGVAGLVFAVLTTAALLLMRDIPPATEAEFAAWWETYAPRFYVALYLIPFAGIAFLWLLAALRHRIGRREDQFFATVLLGSGLLFVAMLFASGAAAAAAAVATERSDRSSYDAFLFGRSIARAFFFGFAVKMAAAFMLVASTIGRRTGVFPRWFTIVGAITGLALLLSVTMFEPVALAFPLWVAILSVLLLRGRPGTATASPGSGDGPGVSPA
jgi:hypothetical protein